MDITKKLYQDLGPRERAIACYAALNRNDLTETDRLTGNMPHDRVYNWNFLGLGQAMDVYNQYASRAKIDLLQVVGDFRAALAYCEGWLDAGGSLENEKYQNNYLIATKLPAVIESLVAELDALGQVACEWCEKNHIPKELFSGPLCITPIGKLTTTKKIREENETGESSMLMRSVFDAIKLAK
jgi:hypothetical protein